MNVIKCPQRQRIGECTIHYVNVAVIVAVVKSPHTPEDDLRIARAARERWTI